MCGRRRGAKALFGLFPDIIFAGEKLNIPVDEPDEENGLPGPLGGDEDKTESKINELIRLLIES